MKKTLFFWAVTLAAAVLSGTEADFNAPSAWRKGMSAKGVLTVTRK